MTLPSTEDVFRIDEPSSFISLLARDDLNEASASWWIATISACSSCFTLAATDADLTRSVEWARVLVSVLDAAARSGLLSQMEVLSRRVHVQISSLSMGYRDFGDANAICGAVFKVLHDMGEDFRMVASEVRESSTGKSRLNSRVAELSKLRQVIRQLATMRESIPVGDILFELDSWMSALKIT